MERMRNNIQYICSEQYFMYHKCKTFYPTNNILLQTILTEKSATNIKKYGRELQNYNDTIWKEKRYNIMLDALRLKFKNGTQDLL
jgi:hypothetical protein